MGTTLICGIILNTFAYAEDIKTSLTLDEAVKIGIENSDILEINKINMENKKVNLRQTQNSERKFNKYAKGEDQSGFLLEEEVASLGVKYEIEELEMKNEYIKKNLEANISKLYYGALQSRDMLSIKEDTLKNLEDNYKIVSKKYSLGTASKYDLNMMEIDLNNGKVEVEKARDSYRQVIRNLNNLLDYPMETKLSLSSGYVLREASINLGEDLKQAYEKRYDYIVAKNTLALANENFRVVKMSYTPNTYKYKLENGNTKIVETSNKNMKKTIEADIKAKYDNLTTSKNEITLMDTNIKKAEEGLRVLKLQYDLNMATMLQVNEALVGLNQAKLGKASAIGDYNIALIEYERAVKIGDL